MIGALRARDPLLFWTGAAMVLALIDRSGIGASRNVMVATGIVWLAAMGGLLMLALQGRPLLAL